MSCIGKMVDACLCGKVESAVPNFLLQLSIFFFSFSFSFSFSFCNWQRCSPLLVVTFLFSLQYFQLLHFLSTTILFYFLFNQYDFIPYIPWNCKLLKNNVYNLKQILRFLIFFIGVPIRPTIVWTFCFLFVPFQFYTLLFLTWSNYYYVISLIFNKRYPPTPITYIIFKIKITIDNHIITYFLPYLT